MVRQDAGEQVLVCEYCAQDVFGDGGEGVVGWGEDGEWSVAVEGVDEVGFDNGGDQGAEDRVVGCGGAGGVVGHAGEAAFAVRGNGSAAGAIRAERCVFHSVIAHGVVGRSSRS